MHNKMRTSRPRECYLRDVNQIDMDFQLTEPSLPLRVISPRRWNFLIMDGQIQRRDTWSSPVTQYRPCRKRVSNSDNPWYTKTNRSRTVQQRKVVEWSEVVFSSRPFDILELKTDFFPEKTGKEICSQLFPEKIKCNALLADVVNELDYSSPPFTENVF